MALLAAIYRHPIKAHGREALEHTHLHKDEVLPYDRIWAIQHDQAKQEFDDAWLSCNNMMRGARAGRLQAIECRLDLARGEITLTHPDLDPITVAPDTKAGAAALIDWSTPLANPARGMPKRVIKLPKHGLTDADFPSVSIMNVATLAELSQVAGQDLSPHRWRGNLWVDGWPAWTETNLIGKTIRIGDAELHIQAPIARCKMTAVNPDTGYADVNTLALLKQQSGVQNFGVVARVTKTGDICKHNPIDIL